MGHKKQLTFYSVWIVIHTICTFPYTTHTLHTCACMHTIQTYMPFVGLQQWAKLHKIVWDMGTAVSYTTEDMSAAQPYTLCTTLHTNTNSLHTHTSYSVNYKQNKTTKLICHTISKYITFNSTCLVFRFNLICSFNCSTTGVNIFIQFSFRGVYLWGGTAIRRYSNLPPSYSIKTFLIWRLL